MGVARRRNMPLKGIQVEIVANHLFPGIQETVEASSSGRKVGRQQALKKVILTGPLDERQFETLKNSAVHCPVGRLMENGLVEFVHEFVLLEG